MKFACSLGLAALSIAVLLAATPARATLSSAEDVSVYSQLRRLADRLKAEGNKAINAAGQAAGHALEQSQHAITDARSELAPYLQTFGKMLNERKARLAIIGADAAAIFETWRQTTEKSWSDIKRAANEALKRFRDWINQQFVPDEQVQIPV